MKFKGIMLVTILLLAILTLGSVSASDDLDSLTVSDAGDDELLASPSVNDVDLLSDGNGTSGYNPGNTSFDVNTTPVDDESEEEGISADVYDGELDIGSTDTVIISIYCPENTEGYFLISVEEDEFSYYISESDYNTNITWTLSDLNSYIQEDGYYYICVNYIDADENWEFINEGELHLVDNTKFRVEYSSGFAYIYDKGEVIFVYCPEDSYGKVIDLSIFHDGEFLNSISYNITPEDCGGFVGWTLSELGIADADGYDVSVSVDDGQTFTYNEEFYVFYPLDLDNFVLVDGDFLSLSWIILNQNMTNGYISVSSGGVEYFNKALSEIERSEIMEGGPNRGRVGYNIWLSDLNTTFEEGKYEFTVSFYDADDNVTYAKTSNVTLIASNIVFDDETGVSIEMFALELDWREDEIHISRIEAPLDTSGYIVAYVNGDEYFCIPLFEFYDSGDSLEEYIFPYDFALGAGTYNITVSYYNVNDEEILTNSVIVTLTGEKEEPAFDVHMDGYIYEINYLEVATVIIESYIRSPTDYSVFVNGELYSNITVYSEDSYSIDLEDLTPGEYEVLVTFIENNAYVESNRSVSFTVSKIETEIEINADNIFVGDELFITFHINSDLAEKVFVRIDSVNYTVSIENGEGQLTVYNLSSGDYEITAEYFGDDCYLPSSSKTSVTVMDRQSLYIFVEDIDFGEDLIIDVYDGDNDGNVTFFVGSNQYSSPLIDGHAQLNVSGLAIGEYTIRVISGGLETSTTVNVRERSYTFSDLQELIDNAESGSIIYLEHDYVNNDNTTITIDKAITVDGNGHTLDGNGQSGIMSINADDVIIANIVFINGNSNDGGAIFTYLDLTVINSTFINNTAANSGGAISSWGTVDVINSIFIDNRAGYGGAIYSNSNVINSTFMNNIADDDGGALYGSGYVINCTFADNTPNDMGYLASTDIVIELNSNFIQAGDDLIIDMYITEGATGQLIIIVDNSDNYFADLENNHARYVLSNLSSGKHSIDVVYNGDETHAFSQSSVNVIVLESELYVDTADVSIGDDLIIDVYVATKGNDTATISFNGRDYEVLLTEGYGQLIISDLDVGTYDIVAIYNNSSVNHTITVAYTFKNLQNLIDNAEENSIIFLEHDYIYLSSADSGLIYISKPITIDGNGHIIDGNQFQLIRVDWNEVTLSNIIFTNVHYNGIYIDYGATLNIVNCSFINNTLSEDYYLINCYESNLNIINSNFDRTKKQSIYSDVDYTVINSTFVKADSDIIINHEVISYDGNMTINVQINGDATGSIELYLNGTMYSTVAVNESLIVFDIYNLTVGNYDVLIVYSGDENYNPSNLSSSFSVVNKSIPSMSVMTNDIAYGEEEIVTVSLPSDSTGSVEIYLNGTLLGSESVVDGYAVFTLYNLDVGEYEVVMVYLGDVNYFAANASGSFSVIDEVNPVIGIMANNITYGEDLVITVNSSVSSGVANVIVGDLEYNVTLVDHVGSVVVGGLSAGEYSILVYVANSTATVSVVVARAMPSVDVLTSNITSGDVETVTVFLPSDATGRVDLYVNGDMFSVTVYNGSAVFDVYNLTEGHYNIMVVYPGDMNYWPVDATSSFTVMGITPTINVIADNITYGEDLVITVNASVSSGVASVVIDGKEYNVTLVDHVGSVVVGGLSAGEYSIVASVGGSSNVTSVVVAKATPAFTIEASDITVGEVLYVNVSTKDNIANWVSVSVVKEFSNETSIVQQASLVNGTVQFAIANLTEGTYSVQISYEGDNNYASYVNNTVVNVIADTNKTDYIAVTANNITYGDSLTVDVYAGLISDTVNLSINNITYYVSLNNGIGQLNISNLNSGLYLIEVSYKDLYNSTTVRVDKKNPVINISCSDIVYDEDLNITVDVDVPGNVTVFINGEEYTTAELINNQLNLLIPNLSAGNYSILVNYIGDDNHYYNNATSIAFIDKKDTTISINSENINYGHDLNVTININATGNVSVSIANMTYNAEIINNEVSLAIPNLNVGNYTVVVTYFGDANHNSNIAEYNVSVMKQEAVMEIICEDIVYGEDLALTVNINATGSISVIVSGKEYNVSITDNRAELDISGLGAGDHIIVLNYSGDDNYEATSSNCTVTVNKKSTEIAISGDDITYGEILFINITLSEAIDDEVIVSDGNSNYTVDLVNGTGNLSIPDLNAGNYSIYAVYLGNDNLLMNTTYINISVVKKPTYIVITSENIVFGEDLIIDVSLSEAIDESIALMLRNNLYIFDLVNGTCHVNISDLEADSYPIVVNYAGNDNLLSSKNNTSVTVNKKLPTLTINATNAVYGENLIVNVIIDELAGGNISLIIDDEIYNATLKNSSATLSIPNLNAGSYSIELNYYGDNNFMASQINSTVTIDKKDASLNINDYNITYLDDLEFIIDLNENINDSVVLTLNNKDYNVDLINGRGNISISELNTGSYIAIVQYAGNSNLNPTQANSTVTVNKLTTSIHAYANPSTYGEALVLNMELGGASTVSTYATGSVLFIINNQNYTTTFVSPTTSVNVLNLDAGTYMAEAIYSGDSNFNSISTTFNVTINPKATITTAHSEIAVYGDNLIVDIEVSDLANGTAQLSIGDANYTAEINDGVGKAVIPNIGAGNYSVIVSYLGSNNFAPSNTTINVIVNKKELILNVSCEDIVFGQDAVINIKASSPASGNVVASIDGKTYSGELINGSGSVTVSNLTAKLYSVDVNYEGNENYTQASAQSNLTVGKAPSIIIVSAEDILVNDAAEIVIELNGLQTGQLEVYISNEFNQTVNITSANITVPISGLTVGNYSVLVTYYGDDNYLGEVNTTAFNVNLRPPVININAPDVNDGEDAVINVNIENATGDITVSVNGSETNLTLNNSQASLTIANLTVGVYNVTVSYMGDDVYADDVKSATFNVLEYTYTYKDIQKLINNAASGSTINLVRDYVYDAGVDNNTITISKAITIIANRHVIDATGKAGIFTITADNVVLDGFVLTNASSVDGGAINWLGNNGQLSNSSINASNAVRGGAIFINASNINISDSEFDYNTANTGAAILSQGTNTTISNSLFMYNKATIGAGVVLGEDGGKIIRSQFLYNDAVNGAGLVIYGDDATIFGSTFLLNTATIGAGAVSYGKRTVCEESFFISNVAFTDYSLSSNGLLMASENDVLTAEENEEGFGAGLVIYGDDAVITNSEFIGNNATHGAGLILVANNCNVNTSLFENNTADEGAGVIITGDDVAISESNFTNNTAKSGAGIITNGTGTVIDNSAFSENTADNGAGILSNGDNLSVSNSSFVSNSAVLGAGIIVNSANAVISNSNFTKNNATNGAGILANSTNTTIAESKFEENEALLGSAIYVKENADIVLEYEVETPPDILTIAFEPTLEIEAANIHIGEDAVINVSVTSTSGQVSGKVIIKVDNESYEINLTNGLASKSISALPVGNYTVDVNYTGDINHTSVFKTANFTVSRISLDNITPVIDGTHTGEDTVITIDLPSDATGNITTEINNRSIVTPVNGSVSITIENLSVGNYSLNIHYSGDNKYSEFDYNDTIIYESNIVIATEDLIKYYKGSERFAANISDYKGNALANVNVTIAINGQNYTRTTDENGTASMAINLRSDVYNVTVTYNDTVAYATITVKNTVISENLTKIFKNDSQYYATFVDSQGNLLKNTEVKFNINGVFYTRQINASGIARMNINLNPGTYVLTAENPSNGELYSSTITVLPSIVEANNLTKYYRNDSQYTLKVLDGNGNAVGAGVNVTFNINGVFYTRQTNASGYVSMKINLSPGTYTITAEYNGMRVSNTIDVLSTLSASDLSMKYRDGSRFTAKLVDGQGRPYANQNVTFNINGVLYNRVTDSEGNAGLNINLMAGKYIITTMFNGLNIANKITISG